MRMKKSVSVILLLAMLMSTLSIGALIANAGEAEKKAVYNWKQENTDGGKTYGNYTANVFGENEPTADLGWVSLCTPSSVFNEDGSMVISATEKESSSFGSGSCKSFMQYELSCNNLPDITEGYIEVKNNTATGMKFQLIYTEVGEGWRSHDVTIAAESKKTVYIENAQAGDFKIQIQGSHATDNDWWYTAGENMFELSPIYVEEEPTTTTEADVTTATEGGDDTTTTTSGEEPTVSTADPDATTTTTTAVEDTTTTTAISGDETTATGVGEPTTVGAELPYKWNVLNKDYYKATGWYASNDHFPELAGTPIDKTFASYCNSKISYDGDGNAIIDVKETDNDYFAGGVCKEFGQFEMQFKNLPEIAEGYMNVKNNSNIDIVVEVLYDRSDDDTDEWKKTVSDIIPKGETGVVKITNVVAGSIKLQIGGSKVGENWWFVASDKMFEISAICANAADIPAFTEPTSATTEPTATEPTSAGPTVPDTTASTATTTTTTATTTNTTPTDNTDATATTATQATEPVSGTTTIPATTVPQLDVDIENDSDKGEIEKTVNADGSITLNAKLKEADKYIVVYDIEGDDCVIIECTATSITFKSDSNVKVNVIYIARITYGDVNGDNKITAADVLLMRKHIAGQNVELNADAADVNLDDKVTAADVLLVRKYIAGQKVVLGFEAKG